ncbi:microcystin degradation protein MlrC [Peribacillus deserti]|uniref:Microcystin degradation protein MlrC n=1 Tax=Peribacillus deserti TaxID=673318 RepID=A0ABS2QF90_9BACI|nr:M81 family metallopeptidase [Peribacillus deserti]MBM7691193.1 microcystin degradation protein MlrC [Peribacillus deserti]
MAKLKVGIAFFYHESHSFVSGKTTLKDFRDEGYFKGQEIMEAYLGTKTEVGGFIDVLSAENRVEIVPLLCAAAIPSGVVSFETYHLLEQELMSSLLDAGRLDGLLLALHGSMVAENVLDPERELLSKIRAFLGPDIPIATTLDMHANLSSEMIEYTPYHFGFKTYPHIDMYDQGVKAARTLLQHLLEGKRAEAAFIKLPMMPPSINMKTAEGPMHTLVTLAKGMENKGEIMNASVFGGFPYSDVPMAGASVLTIARTKEEAEKAAKRLAKKFWDVKEEFIQKLPGVKDGVQLALIEKAEKPVVLADISDNPLSCGSGDTTELLREIIRLNLKGSLFGGLNDPESIEKCRKSGIGTEVELTLGGKISPEFGLPIKLTARVNALSDGVFYNSGPFNQNLRVDAKGAAYITAGNVDILLIGRGLSANDPEMFRHIGIEPAAYHILGLKVKNHFRAAFDPLISKVIYIDAPGAASNDLTHFKYKNIPHQIWPFKTVQFELSGEDRQNGNS